MRMLLGALALAASILHTTTRAGQVQTLYTSPAHQAIAAFAQDGGLVAWFAPYSSPKQCNVVWLWQLGSAKQHLPLQGSKYHNVTCQWQVPTGSPVELAIADNNGSPAVLWTLHESATQALKFDYVLGATVANPEERRFEQVAHASHGAGLWLTGVAGSGNTLVYSVAEVAYKNQVDCLTTPKQPGACDLNVVGGGVYRVVGRKLPVAVEHARPAVAIAAFDGSVAFVPAAGGASTDGHPLSSPVLPVEVRDAHTGKLEASISPEGTPIAIALSSTTLSLLGRDSGKLVLSWYDLAGGKPAGSVQVPNRTAKAIAAGEGFVVFRVGRSIRMVDLKSGHVRKVAKAAAAPIGLSVAGTRIAWAENVRGRGRIRAVTLAP